LEDVYLTGFVAEACKIPRINMPGFFKHWFFFFFLVRVKKSLYKNKFDSHSLNPFRKIILVRTVLLKTVLLKKLSLIMQIELIRVS
jgi:hypothetical protein